MSDPTFDQEDGLWRDEDGSVLYLIGSVDLGFNKILVYENAKKERLTMVRDEVKGPIWEPMVGDALPTAFTEAPPDAS